MSLGQNLEQRQTQSLVLTPQLKQLLRIVQMNNTELAAHIDAELERNPLLEKQTDLEERSPETDPVWNGPSSVGGVGGDLDLMDLVANPLNLQEHLSTQIIISESTAKTRQAALLLIGELSDEGYLGAELTEFADQYELSDSAAAAGLALLQDCDPTGVGARNLQECLQLQLRERGILGDDMKRLLTRLGDVSVSDPAGLAEQIGVSEARLATLMTRIRSLDPKPGLAFATGATELAVPDVFVRPDPTSGWRLELNTETLPRVLVNNQYAAHIDTLKEEERAYILECRSKASWLVKAMEQRARTILSVASEIVKQQSGFFAGGIGDLTPMTQRNVAEQLNIHESTVSRVVAGKYLACKQGNFALQFFFSQGIATANGSAEVSATAVQESIRKLIADEDPKKPLSDDKIVTILKERNLSIARRTVTKYREALRLPSSVQRRRMNALKKH